MNRPFKNLARFFLPIVCAALFLGVCGSQQLLSAENKVYMIQLNDATINPVTAGYIIESIDKAYRANAQCLIIKLDTPGGLLNSTRSIVKAILTARIPVIVYVAPGGSRAGSAGVFITYASHVAAMAPSTNIGAAHPVQLDGGETPKRMNEWKEWKELMDASSKKEDIRPDEDPMESKILHDTTAFIKALAEKRGRNVDWAVASVVESASITDSEALEKKVVEIIAPNERDLLKQLDGRIVKINDKEITLRTREAVIEEIAMDPRQKFFNILADPNIVYFLMILGFYGLLFEITHPGIGISGILGAIFLILAFYGMQTLPTNYAGLALLILGIVLLIAEAYTPAFGLLTLGGLSCLILGSMLLFKSVDPIMRVSGHAIFAVSLTTAAISLFLIRSVVRTHRAKVLGGKEGLVGSEAEAQTHITPAKGGRVFVHGEIWDAVSDEEIRKGDRVIVTEIKGLTVKVKRK